ncbi:MAG: nucleotidyl transferase AbiEii/AbiGii toxin family protein, partial [Dehalococcoidia bacterium]|nr:nucleotidyl transferase AbiEii/AbiGii toxin family protein [Dehalococcoidia bacterium]
EVSRVKDLVDILLIGQMCDFEIEVLRDALISIFQARNTHPVPERLPSPPRFWNRPFSRLATELDAPWSRLEEAALVAEEFLDPVLSGQAGSTWNAIEWRWTSVS